MENRYLLLNDVSRLLGLKAHKIVYALATGQVAEPPLRVANKRVFSEEDVRRLASHFRVSPRWPAPNADTNPDDQVDGHDGLVLRPPFSVESTDETCNEVRDGDGVVYCWASDRAKALILAGLLE